MHLTGLIFATLLTCTPSTLAKKKDDAVLLSNVKSLTLRDGRMTSHRRVEAIPQLSCVGGNGKDFYHVDVMRCQNSGSEYDAEDIQWTCKADLPPEFKLGSTEVICEGYDNADDRFVLKGSCGVEYRLVLTEMGEQKYRGHVNSKAWRNSDRDGGLKKKEGGDLVAAVLFWLIFAGIVGIILYSIFFSSGNGNANNGARRGFRNGGGGGGGGGYDDGHDDPPPPYTPRAPKPKSNTSTSSSRSSSSRQQNQSWRPGFFSGAATGAAAGYAAGAWNNRQQDRDQTRAGPSSWFGGNNNSPSNSYGRSFGNAGPSNSAPSPSSSRQESTGFGGTRRR